MILKNLRLTSFKNHPNSSFAFGNRINCVLGKNGTGKTNLLDAIYYLSFSKSALGSPDRLLVTHEHPSFTLYGAYDHITLAIQSEKGKTKTIKIDGKEPDKLSDLIGKVPLVMVLPDDTQMIREGSETRRKFFDGALCQVDPDYLESLLRYNKLLKQRNSLLKLSEDTPLNYPLLETYDEVLVPLALQLSSKRQALIKLFLPFLEKNYKDLHDGEELPGLNFKSHVGDDFASQLKSNIQRDQLMKRTLLGSHRDDYEFLLDNEPIKRFGSQGQQKTFIIALKLALFDFLKQHTGKTPLLLLDDIFDKLDDSRIQQLVILLQDPDRFGQIFVSDARKDRTKVLLKEADDVNIIEI